MGQEGAQHGHCGWSTKCGGEAEASPAGGLVDPAKSSGEKNGVLNGGGRVGSCNMTRFVVSKCLFWIGAAESMNWSGSQVNTGRPVGRGWTSANEQGLRLIQAFLCPFVNADRYCADVRTRTDLFFGCLI